MNEDIISELLSTAQTVLQDQVREYETLSTQTINDIFCMITRSAEIKHDIQLPNNLKQALDKDYIQTRHLPKKFIREYIRVVVTKNSIALLCEANIQRNNDTAAYENTFQSKIITGSNLIQMPFSYKSSD